ncbi:rho GTPase-activating protein 15 isoform X2 [Electrophorus electricus]|uniref:rho GTPase-activating protein 15 isoform X2 n=1 Tax=Electrophorus electricus TaxID=8005 RepID=UPI0015D01E4B|nr:rho GTPase-activating protein 15 isoform X2 [Electrophorus electricus]
MLSGSWRRSPVGPTRSLPVGRGSMVGGTTILEALYDYSYHGVDGRMISIQEGERFTLLKKANSDWWQVRRFGTGTKGKALYVPATYVQEVPISMLDLSRPGGQTKALPTGTRLVGRGSLSPCSQTQCLVTTKAFCRSMEDLNCNGVIPELHVAQLGEAGGACPIMSRSDTSTSSSGQPVVQPGPTGLIPRSQSSSDLPHNPYKEGRQPGKSAAGPGRFYSQWDMANTAHRHTDGQIQAYISKSPLPEQERKQCAEPPCPLPDQKPLQLLQMWEQYRDPASGRYYYVNTLTEERSWKPPRRVHQSNYIQYMATVTQAETFSRDSNHLSLPLHSSGRKPTHRLFSDFTCSSRNANNWQLSQELEKAGLLNKTKIAEGGRKLRKNWNLSWVVLVGNSLMFFKDPKTQSPEIWKPGNSCPESSVDLRGAKLNWANDLSSRKNVFKLRTVTGNEFLLQSETVSLISEWYTTIQKVIDKLDKDNPLDNVLLYSLRRAGSMEMLDQSGDEEENRTGFRTTLPRSVSNLENSERKRVKNRLKKLIMRRPPLQALQEKGLIKDQVFGCSLEVLCEREKSTVPRFVRKCTETVEKKGLDTDGIYRVSGNLAVIQKLRFAVNHERAVSTDGRYLFPEHLVQVEHVDLEDPQWEDIHVVTGALKLFFRELPEPLVPYRLFHDMVETVKISDYLDKVDRMKSLVISMPCPNRDTMRHMFHHLKRVMEHSDSNRMTTQNIGIVFGPTLMRPESDCGNIAINMVYQNQAVELILTECEQIFGPESPQSL